MNIFVLHPDPTVAAQYHCDKHVVKMILESKQILQTCQGATAWKNHPASKWTQSNPQHAYWLTRLGNALCQEYTARYHKVHACSSYFDDYQSQFLSSVTAHPPEHFVFCGPQELLTQANNDVVEAYRLYYIRDKSRFAKWKTQTPDWYQL